MRKNRAASWQLVPSYRLVNTMLVFSMAGAMAFMGCKKKQPASQGLASQAPASESGPPGDEPARSGVASTAASASPGQKTKPAPPPPAYVTARAQNILGHSVQGEVDTFLTQQLQAFVKKNNRWPENFAEFATTTLDSIPRPPEGKKWVIDLDTSQVKAVASQ
jgi:hypothetical protein